MGLKVANAAEMEVFTARPTPPRDFALSVNWLAFRSDFIHVFIVEFRMIYKWVVFFAKVVVNHGLVKRITIHLTTKNLAKTITRFFVNVKNGTKWPKN